MPYPDQLVSLVYGQVVSVPANTLTKIVEVTNVEARTYLGLILCSGSVYAEFYLFKNGVEIAKQRSGPSRNVEFRFNDPPFYLEANDSVQIFVKHYKAAESPKFECGIFSVNTF